MKKSFTESGKAVGDSLVKALSGEVAPKSFGKQAVGWIGSLISHSDASGHHPGQNMLALKQNGMRLQEKISVQSLWGNECGESEGR